MSTGDLFAAPAAPRAELEQVLIRVFGVPKPKGSMRAFVVGGKNGLARAVVTHGNDAAGLKTWSGETRLAASNAMAGRTLFVGRALIVNVVFYMPRPVGHLKPGGLLRRAAPMFPACKPDLDKLVRATFDALEGVVFDDDSRIVSTAATKAYEHDGQPRGAVITVRSADRVVDEAIGGAISAAARAQ